MSDNHDPAQPTDPQAPVDAGTEPTPGNIRHNGPDVDDAIGNRGPGGARADDDEEEDDSSEDSIGNRLDAPDPNAALLAQVASPGAPGVAPAAGTGKKRRKRGRKGGDRAVQAGGAPGVPGAPGAQPAGAQGKPAHHHQHGGGSGDAQRRPFHMGDKVRARLITIGDAGGVVDLWGKEQGVIDLRELQVEGSPEPAIGDSVDVVVMQDGSRGGNVVVTRDPQRVELARVAVQQAFDTNELIEGLVTGVNRGGLEVDLAGVRAFCPSSQIDARFPPSVSPKALVLTRQKFKVTSLVDDGKEAIVSRRALVEADLRAKAEEARQNIKVGSVVKGRVVAVKEYGVFVDLGGIEGMIHITELTHIRGARTYDIVKVGDEVEAKVLKITGGH
ncbi:MAG: S1 RNA-binding domain-containing protein, partial [Deltaproteobacteria bacterium]